MVGLSYEQEWLDKKLALDLKNGIIEQSWLNLGLIKSYILGL